jgi:5-dehydro-2-deoxygluconokinase
MFGIHGTPTPEQTKQIASYKTMVYEGFLKAVEKGLPKEKMGILADEQFGEDVLRRAKAEGYTICLPAEKSGQDEFDFEYGSEFGAHIAKYKTDFVKVLVRYNVEGDAAMNTRQAKRLAQLSDYIHTNGFYYMFELLVPPTDEQLARCKGSKEVFDVEIRPNLMVRAIQELQAQGVEADVWKVEGLDRASDFEKVCQAAKAGGRDQVGCIVLGRGENDAKVEQWLTVGAHVPGVIGFAVGRTIFWEPLKGFQSGKLTRDQAIEQIAAKYERFCRLWIRERA